MSVASDQIEARVGYEGFTYEGRRRRLRDGEETAEQMQMRTRAGRGGGPANSSETRGRSKYGGRETGGAAVRGMPPPGMPRAQHSPEAEASI